MRAPLIAAGLALAAMLASPAAAQTAHVQVWVRAFIPDVHPSNPGYIRPVPGQPGKTMLPGPSVPWSDNPLPWVGSCYNTSDRSFSALPAARSKVAVAASFDTDGVSISNARAAAVAAPVTEQYDCETGRITCSKTPDIADVKVATPVYSAGRVTIAVDASGSNPCLGIPAPPITFSGSVVIDLTTGRASFKGEIGGFPSYEAYVAVNGGVATPIFTETPLPGSNAWALLRARAVEASVRVAKLDGVWTSNDPGRRFSLSITGDKCVWSERAANGQTLSRTLTLTPRPGEGYTLLRGNDEAEVLTFLGFSPAILQAIRARGPRPSFLNLRWTGATLSGNWSGLLVIKDDKAQFKEMKQPGELPPKPYVFTRS